MTNAAFTIGIPIYPDANLLDIAGPHQVFATPLRKASVKLVAASATPVTTAEGAKLVPDLGFDECPLLDMLFVPGGPGQVAMMEDEPFIGFLRRQGESARYVSSVCVGSLLLAAAGLLDGYKATTHWAAVTCLQLFPAIDVVPGYPRFVVDRTRITGGGVSSGIDEALEIASLLAGSDTARQIQLLLQYEPRPRFGDGDPLSASALVYDEVWAKVKGLERQRLAQIERILAKPTAQ